MRIGQYIVDSDDDMVTERYIATDTITGSTITLQLRLDDPSVIAVPAIARFIAMLDGRTD